MLFRAIKQERTIRSMDVQCSATGSVASRRRPVKRLSGQTDPIKGTRVSSKDKPWSERPNPPTLEFNHDKADLAKPPQDLPPSNCSKPKRSALFGRTGFGWLFSALSRELTLRLGLDRLFHPPGFKEYHRFAAKPAAPHWTPMLRFARSCLVLRLNLALGLDRLFHLPIVVANSRRAALAFRPTLDSVSRRPFREFVPSEDHIRLLGGAAPGIAELHSARGWIN